MAAVDKPYPVLSYKGKHMNLLQWAKHLEVPVEVLVERYNRVLREPGRYMSPQGRELQSVPFKRKAHYERVLGTGEPPTDRQRIRMGLLPPQEVRPLHTKRGPVSNQGKKIVITHNGEKRSLSGWHKHTGIPYSTIVTRYRAIKAKFKDQAFTHRSHAEDMLREFQPRAVRLVEPGRTKALPRFVRPVEDCFDSPYHDLTDAEFYKLQAHAKDMGVHMTVIRELMRDATKHKEILEGLRNTSDE